MKKDTRPAGWVNSFVSETNDYRCHILESPASRQIYLDALDALKFTNYATILVFHSILSENTYDRVF